jgi:hypothetical protein
LKYRLPSFVLPSGSNWRLQALKRR